MSITFTFDLPADEYERAPHSVTCGCSDVEPMLFPNASSSGAFIAHWRATPEDERVVMEGCADPDLCRHYTPQVTPLGIGAHLDVNMANGNARHILSVLGLLPETVSGTTRNPFLEDDVSGDTTAEDFKGRVLLAMAVSPTDEGTPQVEHPTSGARLIDTGRSPVYTERILAALLTLADAAIERGAPIRWY